MKRTLVLSIAVAAMLMALVPTAAGAATPATWKATLGANGTVTVKLLASGAGSAVLALKGLPRSSSVSTVVKGGTCGLASGTIATLPTYRSSASGTLSQARPLPVSAMNAAQLADGLAVRVSSGVWSKCAVLKGGPVQAAGSFGGGTKLVGPDIKAGTYRTRIPTGTCYWARLSGVSGAIEDIIASDIGRTYSVVTIGSTDVAFKSNRCGVWSSDLSAVTTSRTTFGSGTMIVGTDILPGRYRATGAIDTCYWARLSGFGGSIDEILASDIGDASPIVDIAVGDKGFTSNRCGTWSLVGAAVSSPLPSPSPTPSPAAGVAVQVGQKIMVGGKAYLTVTSLTPVFDGDQASVRVGVRVEALQGSTVTGALDFALRRPDGSVAGPIFDDISQIWYVTIDQITPYGNTLLFHAPLVGSLDLVYDASFGSATVHIRN